jgi:hypothetical protein
MHFNFQSMKMAKFAFQRMKMAKFAFQKADKNWLIIALHTHTKLWTPYQGVTGWRGGGGHGCGDYRQS